MRKQASELTRDVAAAIVTADDWRDGQFAFSVDRQCFDRSLCRRTDRVALHAGEQFPVDQVARVLIDECHQVVLLVIDFQVHQIGRPNLVDERCLLNRISVTSAMSVHQLLVSLLPGHST